MTDWTIRTSHAEDLAALLEMIPQLADFPLPQTRDPRDLWQGDARLLQRHFNGETDHTRVLVADSETDGIIGFALTSLGEEVLSHDPSAHLEALVVSDKARGKGVGRALLLATEQLATTSGAQTLTLTAFNSNTRARGLYESVGFDGELIRYIKPLTKTTDSNEGQ
ncbi:MAG: GNAT family N-acetyltransferase [Pseudomonadota bacterium]